MVSYFVPRGRFLIKASKLRILQHQKQQQQQSQQFHHQQQQQQQGRWPLLRNFRQTFSAQKQATTEHNSDILKQHTTHSFSKTVKQQLDQQRKSNVWLRWTGFLLRWAPFGVLFFGVVEWQLHKKKCRQNQMPYTASEFQAKIYCSLPLRIISRCWGWLAACYVPTSLRPYLYGWYSSAFKVNLNEALYPDYKHYSSLSEFFTRPLKDGVRVIDQKAPLVSPADGKVLHFGSATNSFIEQVKGVNYSIQSFIGAPTWRQDKKSEVVVATDDDYEEAIKERRDGTTTLYQCVIYLAPGDYHRFHSPAEWQPQVRRHFDGELLSVNPRVATWLPGLFCLNERVLYVGQWQHGFFSYTAVGATNVGSVQIYMDEHLKTNRWVGLNVGTHKKFQEYEEMRLRSDTTMNRGDLLGQFNMGSTIVLLFEAPHNFVFDIEAGQTVRVGEPLGHFKNN